ncbi:hypothetical protein [Stenotrophomonas tumulicola]
MAGCQQFHFGQLHPARGADAQAVFGIAMLGELNMSAIAAVDAQIRKQLEAEKKA